MPETNQAGKRYACAECGSVVVCAKPGGGRFHCHGAEMPLVGAKPLPSSD
jgi:hypothetical protein